MYVLITNRLKLIMVHKMLSEEKIESGIVDETTSNTFYHQHQTIVDPEGLLSNKYWENRQFPRVNPKKHHITKEVVEKEVIFQNPSATEYSVDRKDTELWFLGGGTFAHESKKCGMSRLYIINYQIIKENTGFTASERNAFKLAKRFSEFFTKNLMYQIVKLVYSGPYKQHFRTEEDKGSLFLAIIWLVFKARGQVLKKSVIEDINKCTGFSITIKKIKKWFPLIHAYNPNFFSLNLSKLNTLEIDMLDKPLLRQIQKSDPKLFQKLLKLIKFGVDPATFLDSILTTYNDMKIPSAVLKQIKANPKKYDIKENLEEDILFTQVRRVIRANSMALGKEFCKWSKFGRIKPQSMDTWVKAIISRAFKDYTNARGIPFPELSQDKRNYISEQRWHLQKILGKCS